jgi:chromosome segregation ATPase
VIQIDKESGELEVQILQAIDNRIDHAGQEWSTVDLRITGIQETTRKHDHAVTRVQAAIDGFPAEWAAYMRQVLASHSDLVNPQVTTLNVYSNAVGNLNEELKQYEVSMTDVRQKVAFDREAIDRRSTHIVQQRTEVDTLMGELHGLTRRVHDEQAGFVKEIRPRLKEAENARDKLGSMLAQARQELQNLQNLVRKVQVQREELARELEKIEQETKRLEKEKQFLVTEEAHLKVLQEKLRKETDEYRANKTKIEHLGKTHAAEIEQLTRQREKDNADWNREVAAHKAKVQALEQKMNQVRMHRQDMRELYEAVLGTLNGLPDPRQTASSTDPTRHKMAQQVLDRIRQSLQHEPT